jgi:hypothetical protein
VQQRSSSGDLMPGGLDALEGWRRGQNGKMGARRVASVATTDAVAGGVAYVPCQFQELHSGGSSQLLRAEGEVVV